MSSVPHPSFAIDRKVGSDEGGRQKVPKPDDPRRSKIMAAVRRRDTKPEMIVRGAAHRLGLRFRLQAADLPGRPDLVFPKWRTVIFVNGCFWHPHEGCRKASTPKDNAEFWQAKFAANLARDERNYAALDQQGWRVLVFWECELRDQERVQATLRALFPSPSLTSE